MAKFSNIEWCDHTFNIWRGCSKVSPGCANCYAETLSKRNPKTLGVWGPGNPRVFSSEAGRKEVMRWNQEARSGCFQQIVMRNGEIHRGTLQQIARLDLNKHDILNCEPVRPRVFCASMADWLDDEVPVDWLIVLLSLIVETPNLDWLLLTKRPENLRPRMKRVCDELHGSITLSQAKAKALANAFLTTGGTIMHNVWFGVTVENQAMADKRIPYLLGVPAAVRFLSAEPLLGPLDLRSISYCANCYQDAEEETLEDGTPRCSACDTEMCGYALDSCTENRSGINWVIAGGESGSKARVMDRDWVLSLRDQCHVAGVPFLFKQWGKQEKGRLLDGVTHHNFPDLERARANGNTPC